MGVRRPGRRSATGQTLATRLGPWTGLLLGTLGVGAVAWAIVRRRRERSPSRDASTVCRRRPDPAEPDRDRSGPPLGRVLVVIPTYNEAGEPRADRRPRSAPPCPTRDVLVADDNSPDGTGELADKLAADDAHVHVLHRPGKQGLGAAYLAGFRWALERDYDVLVEMDADGSHRPEDLPRMLAALEDADLVLGSRYVPGGTVVNWPWHRLVLSRGGNTLRPAGAGRAAQGHHRRLPRVPARDAARASASTTSQSQGYCFQVDLAWRAVRARLPGRRGADHVRRARARDQQDERQRSSARRCGGSPSGAWPAVPRPSARCGPAAGTGTEAAMSLRAFLIFVVAPAVEIFVIVEVATLDRVSAGRCSRWSPVRPSGSYVMRRAGASLAGARCAARSPSTRRRAPARRRPW